MNNPDDIIDIKPEDYHTEELQATELSNKDQEEISQIKREQEYQDYLNRMTTKEREEFNDKYSLKQFFQEEFREDLIRSHIAKQSLQKHQKQADKQIGQILELDPTNPKFTEAILKAAQYVIDHQIIKNEMPKIQENYNRTERITRTEYTKQLEQPIRVTPEEMQLASKIFIETELQMENNKITHGQQREDNNNGPKLNK